MELIYIANARIPTSKAHGIAIMNACQAFVRAGLSVRLIAARRINPLPHDAHAFYDMKKDFPITRIPVIDLVHVPLVSNKIAFGIKVATFYVSLFFWMLFRSRRTIIYTRDAPVVFLTRLGFRVFLECHVIPGNAGRFIKRTQHANGIVVISQGIRSDLIRAGVPTERIIVAPSGVDLSVFDLSLDKKTVREELTLPSDPYIALYAGTFTTFGEDKGLNDIFKALEILPDDIFFVAVGGGEDDRIVYEALAKKMGIDRKARIIGYTAQKDIARYLQAANVLLMPFPDTPHYRSRMSPLKMFEYMASHRPIIASDLPTIREVLNDDIAVFIAPGDAAALARSIQELRSNSSHAQSLAQKAFAKVAASYTWEQRARAIVAFMKQG